MGENFLYHELCTFVPSIIQRWKVRKWWGPALDERVEEEGEGDGSASKREIEFEGDG